MNGPAHILRGAVAAEIELDGLHYVNFAGSAYLGLGNSPEVRAAGQAAVEAAGAGMPLARSEAIVTPSLLELEQEACTFFAAPAAQFIASGYFFPLIAVSLIRRDVGAIYMDERAHYALRDAAGISGLPAFTYRHCDAEDLARQLSRTLPAGAAPAVLTDGMFPVSGAVPPLDRLSAVVNPYGGRLVVDESHAFGVVGADGRGACAHFGLGHDRALRGGSLGKAFSACGGVVLGTVDEVERARATPVGVGAAAGSAAAAAMAACSLRLVRSRPELLSRLHSNARLLKARLAELGLAGEHNASPVATIAEAGLDGRALQQALFEDRLFVYHTDYVGAPANGLIRLAAFADHSAEHFDQLACALRGRV